MEPSPDSSRTRTLPVCSSCGKLSTMIPTSPLHATACGFRLAGDVCGRWGVEAVAYDSPKRNQRLAL